MSISARVYHEAMNSPNWYNPGWEYRRSVNIDNAGRHSLTDYQVLLTLSKDNFDFTEVSSTGCDLRFTDTDGATEINYWIESYDSIAQEAAIWIKVPHIRVLSSKIIYMYYGNSGASSMSNISNTFLLADDFETFFTGPLDHAVTFLTIPTYDGQNQPVHPDVIYFPEGWNGYKYWMAHTPFTNQDYIVEEIDVVASNDGQIWEIPTGGSLPVVPDDPDYHHADPDILYNPDTDELWLYFLAGPLPGSNAPNSNVLLKLTKSSDGISWSSPNTLISAENLTSPALVRLKTDEWYLFYVQASSDSWHDMTTNFVAHRTSSDGKNWGPEQDTGLTFPGYYPWHMEVKHIPSKSEYWALVQAVPALSTEPGQPGGGDVLLFARGKEPASWTNVYTQPVLERMEAPDLVWDHHRLYRSSFIYHPASDLLEVWYSGLTRTESHIGYTRANYSDFVADLSRTKLWTNIQRGGAFLQSSENAKRGTYSAKLVQDSDVVIDEVNKINLPLSSNFMLEVDFYDDGDTNASKMVCLLRDPASSERVGLGVWIGSSCTNYSYQTTSGYSTTSVRRAAGWHKLGIGHRLIKRGRFSGWFRHKLFVIHNVMHRLLEGRWFSGYGSMQFFIDGVSVGSATNQPNSLSWFMIAGCQDSTGSFHIDDLRIRKYVSQEPTTFIGKEVSYESFRSRNVAEEEANGSRWPD